MVRSGYTQGVALPLPCDGWPDPQLSCVLASAREAGSPFLDLGPPNCLCLDVGLTSVPKSNGDRDRTSVPT